MSIANLDNPHTFDGYREGSLDGAQHPDTVRALIRCHLKAIEFAAVNPAEEGRRQTTGWRS